MFVKETWIMVNRGQHHHDHRLNIWPCDETFSKIYPPKKKKNPIKTFCWRYRTTSLLEQFQQYWAKKSKEVVHRCSSK